MKITPAHTAPFTSHQRAIWLEAQLHPSKPVFNIGTYVLLNEVPDPYLLEQAIQAVIRENDALRMNIQKLKPEDRQCFELERGFQLEVKQFGAHSNAHQKALDWMEEEFIIPIGVNDPLLYQIKVAMFGDDLCYLFFKHHHIYIDGWARALLVRKIANQYNGLVLGEPVEDPSSYAQYVATKTLETCKTAKIDVLQFWKSKFSDFEKAPLFNKKQTDLANAPGSRKRLPLDRSIYNKIDLLGYGALKSQFYFLLASLYITLSRSTGKKELVIGVPLLNRFNEQELNTIGYFIGLVPLKLSFDTDMSFVALAEGIRKEMRSTVPYRDVSIQEINQAVGINFSNGTQLYDVVFSFEPHNHDYHFGDAIVLESGTFSSGYEQNPLVIHVQDFNARGDVNIEFDHNLNYLSKEEVGTLTRRFNNTLHHFVHNTELSVKSAPILLPEEVNILEGNAGRLHNNLATQISKIARLYPTKTALRDNSGELNYQQLWEKALTLAVSLTESGVRKGEAVAIVLPRSKETIVAIAGILLSGAHYVPIDSALPQQRISFMLSEANVHTVISEAKCAKSIDFGRRIVVRIPDEIQEVQNYISPATKPDDPAYVIFTSGTTGQPKGVSVSHQNVMSLTDSLYSEVHSQHSVNAKLGLLSSFSFDASVQHIFMCLLKGFELTIVPGACRKDGKLLVQFLTDHGIQICDGIPTHLSAMMARVSKAPANFPVRHFILGGEAMKHSLLDQFYTWQDQQDVKITNVYGPTECTVDATLFTLDGFSYQKIDEIPIGRPLSNSEIWVLDENLQMVPPGVMGEIFVAGEGVARGYVGQPELTAEKFIHHPTLLQRMYRTGDLGIWDENGQLLFRGRKDSQVKIRGYRIELPEIEHHLSAIKGVQQATVLVLDKERQQYIIGCVESSEPLEQEAYKSALRQVLPEYMVPHLIYSFEAFPLTDTGKIDRKLLLNQVNDQGSDTEECHQPKTATEKILVGIWQELLQVSAIDVNTGFFYHGGDSLCLVYLLARIEDEFGVELSMTEFAANNSVREIAKRIESSTELEREQISLKEELPLLEVLKAMNSEEGSKERNVALLTGVTGFVGAFILQELARDYQKVYCLIRGRDQAAAEKKLRDTLAKYHIDPNNFLAEIEVLKGDLTEQDLGLSGSNLQMVQNSVDAIFHCGAMVNFLTDFETMKRANIGSTLDLLKICKQGKNKQFNYISTKGVFSSSEREHNENSPVADQQHYKDRGYESTKWIAESVANRARAYGVNCNIFRLARITGESAKGVARYDDFFHRFVQGCVLLKCFPQELLNVATDLTPVDITAKAIVGIAHTAVNENFHLINHQRITYKEMLDYYIDEAVMMNVVSYDEWLQKVVLLNTIDDKNPLFTITPILREKKWLLADRVVLRNEETVSRMKEKGIEWPNARSLWHTYVKNCVKRMKNELVSASIII